VTDANLLLGRLPAGVPLAGGLALDRAAAERAIAALAAELGLSPTACAEGIVAVAEAEMLAALRLVTVERGIDPRSFALMPFGGAGGLHATALAEQLGISRVLCPRASGVLSALGLAAAAPRRDVARTVMMDVDEASAGALEAARRPLIEEALMELGEPAVRIRVRHELRYRGQSFELPVEEERIGAGATPGLGPEALRGAFGDAHAARYGYRDESGEIELVNLRVSAWGAVPALAPSSGAETAGEPERTTVVFAGEPVEARLFHGEPAAGVTIEGPALCALPEATLLIGPGWGGEADRDGTIRLSRREAF
jgi:N-methylhydantoinase A